MIRGSGILIVGTGADYDQIVGADTMLGQYSKDNPKTPRSYTVLGPKMRMNYLGMKTGGKQSESIRNALEHRRLPPKGDFLGFDLDDAVYLPIAKFNTIFQ